MLPSAVTWKFYALAAVVYGSAVGSLALADIPRLAHILYKDSCPCGSNSHELPLCKAKRPRRPRTEVNVAVGFQRIDLALRRILTTSDMISDMAGSPTLRDNGRIWGVATCVNSAKLAQKPQSNPNQTNVGNTSVLCRYCVGAQVGDDIPCNNPCALPINVQHRKPKQGNRRCK